VLSSIGGSGPFWPDPDPTYGTKTGSVSDLSYRIPLTFEIVQNRVSPNFRLKRKEAKRKRKKRKRNSEKSVCFASFRKEAENVFWCENKPNMERKNIWRRKKQGKNSNWRVNFHIFTLTTGTRRFYIHSFFNTVVDPKLFITDPDLDPDPTFQWVPDPDPDPTLKKFRCRIRPFSWRNMILKFLKWHFKTWSGSGSRTLELQIRQKFRILADPDPQHCSKVHYIFFNEQKLT
jgi:hypothetical protein